MTTRTLLIVMSAVEAPTGLALIALPSTVALLLLGSSLDTAVATTVGRITGVALLALGAACWFAREDGAARSAIGLIGAMLLYNAVAAAVLIYAGTGDGLSGVGLWPAVVVHAGLAVWCAANQRNSSVKGRKGPK